MADSANRHAVVYVRLLRHDAHEQTTNWPIKSASVQEISSMNNRYFCNQFKLCAIRSKISKMNAIRISALQPQPIARCIKTKTSEDCKWPFTLEFKHMSKIQKVCIITRYCNHNKTHRIPEFQQWITKNVSVNTSDKNELVTIWDNKIFGIRYFPQLWTH